MNLAEMLNALGLNVGDPPKGTDGKQVMWADSARLKITTIQDGVFAGQLVAEMDGKQAMCVGGTWVQNGMTP